MASSSKTFLLLGFLFALVILISSEVSARELAEIIPRPVINPGTVGNPCSPYSRGCHNVPVRPPGAVVNCSRYRKTACTPPRSPPQGHNEKQGPGVGAETQTGN